MANPKQQLYLKRGGKKWNQWRQNNPKQKINLQQASLEKANLEGAHLEKASLTKANLANANLVNAYLEEAHLVKAKLHAANLAGARLVRANLRGAHLEGASLINAYLNNADLEGAHLEGANLQGASLVQANLKGANLEGANLEGANLEGANLERAFLREASLANANLARASLEGANLIKANLVKANFDGANLAKVKLVRVNLEGANLARSSLDGVNLIRSSLDGANLVQASLIQANLVKVSLIKANLEGACLKGANLEGANLLRAQVLAANFKAATFTGACFKDWNANRLTNLEGAKAEYIYSGHEKGKFTDRRPHSGNFKPGEFAALFQQALDTLDLIFVDGINWQAFFTSFQDLRQQYSNTDLNIQAIEKKGDSFLIRLEISEEIDKTAIEQAAKTSYQQQLQIVEARYQEKLQGKDELIDIYRKQGAEMTEIVKSLANRPGPNIHVDARNQSSNQTNYGGTNFQSNISGGTVNQAGSTNANRHQFPNNMKGTAITNLANVLKDNATQNCYSPEQHQALAEAAEEIQALLDQLSEIYPPNP